MELTWRETQGSTEAPSTHMHLSSKVFLGSHRRRSLATNSTIMNHARVSYRTVGVIEFVRHLHNG